MVLRFHLNNLLLLIQIGSRISDLAAVCHKDSTDVGLGVVHLVTQGDEPI